MPSTSARPSVGQDAEHAAPLARVGAGAHDHEVALLDAGHQTTSGASETIFMKPFGAQLAGDGAEDARAARVALLVHEDDRVAVEPDVGTVGAAHVVARADHDAADDGARP